MLIYDDLTMPPEYAEPCNVMQYRAMPRNAMLMSLSLVSPLTTKEQIQQHMILCGQPTSKKDFASFLT